MYGVCYLDERQQRIAEEAERFLSWLRANGLVIHEQGNYFPVSDARLLDLVRDYVRENC